MTSRIIYLLCWSVSSVFKALLKSVDSTCRSSCRSVALNLWGWSPHKGFGDDWEKIMKNKILLHIFMLLYSPLSDFCSLLVKYYVLWVSKSESNIIEKVNYSWTARHATCEWSRYYEGQLQMWRSGSTDVDEKSCQVLCLIQKRKRFQNIPI